MQNARVAHPKEQRSFKWLVVLKLAGRPRGAWANKAWRDALRIAVLRPVDDDEKPKTKLDELVASLIKEARDGDVTALKEIGDRLDGKVPQALIGGDEDDAPISFQFIELRAVRPNAAPSD
jgi:hypothetical protein